MVMKLNKEFDWIELEHKSFETMKILGANIAVSKYMDDKIDGVISRLVETEKSNGARDFINKYKVEILEAHEKWAKNEPRETPKASTTYLAKSINADVIYHAIHKIVLSEQAWIVALSMIETPARCLDVLLKTLSVKDTILVCSFLFERPKDSLTSEYDIELYDSLYS